MKPFSVMAVILALSGCAQLGTTPSQQLAGIARYEVIPIQLEGVPEPAYHVKIENGKEIGMVSVRAYKLESGEVQIEVDQKDVLAFDGQRISAEAVAQIMQAFADAGVEISTAIIEGILKAAGLP